MFIFRSFREDQKFFNKIGVDPFSNPIDPFTFIVKKNISIVFRFYSRIHNVLMEHIVFFIFILFLVLNTLDFSTIFLFKENNFLIIYNLSFFKKFLIVIFFLMRQSTYFT
jgi:hypothetical protein